MLADMSDYSILSTIILSCSSLLSLQKRYTKILNPKITFATWQYPIKTYFTSWKSP
jgi:hypothetical protein